MLLEKGVAFILAFLALFSSLSGCAFDPNRPRRVRPERSLSAASPEEGRIRAEAMLGNIIQALEEQNHTMLKDLFSEETLRTVDNLDEQIAVLMQFFQGTLQSFEGNPRYPSSEGGRMDGREFFEIMSQNIAVTDKEKYHIHFVYHTINEIYPEKVGLERLRISTLDTFERSREAELEGRVGIEWSMEPGIHVHEWPE